MDTIKLKRATKSVANASTKVLEKDEVLVVTPDSGSGKGKCQLKFGDGITAAKSLPIAIDGENADEMKVSTIPTDSDENPVLSAGETVKVFFGKIKKKFTYLENLVGNVKSVTNLFGNTDAKTVAQGLQILVNTKLSKTDKYDGVDSTSTELWATANAVRKVNEKTDNNSTSIRELNSNLAYITGVMPSSTENRKKVADYPDGWNINSVKGMVPIVYRMDNITAWVTIGSNATFYLMADGIYAYTNDSNFSQKQFKLLLRK